MPSNGGGSGQNDGEKDGSRATKGDIIFIPAYWWNSVKYGKGARVLLLQYMTYTNAIAISPHLIRHLLQQQNIKHRTLKKMKLEIPEINKTNQTKQTKQTNQAEQVKQVGADLPRELFP